MYSYFYEYFIKYCVNYQISNLDFVSVKNMCSKLSVNIRYLLYL